MAYIYFYVMREHSYPSKNKKCRSLKFDFVPFTHKTTNHPTIKVRTSRISISTFIGSPKAKIYVTES